MARPYVGQLLGGPCSGDRVVSKGPRYEVAYAMPETRALFIRDPAVLEAPITAGSDYRVGTYLWLEEAHGFVWQDER